MRRGFDSLLSSPIRTLRAADLNGTPDILNFLLIELQCGKKPAYGCFMSVCRGVILHSLPLNKHFKLGFSTITKCRAVRSASGCGGGWRRAWFRCPPGDWGCQIGRSGKSEPSWRLRLHSHQSPACSRCASQSTQASGPGIHQRGRGLTSRKMSSTLHKSGAQCHRLAQHERSPFRRNKRDKK